MTADQAKQKLIDAGMILEAQGQGDFTRGHVSVRVPGDPTHFFMKPHSYGLGEITMENIVVCNLEGEKVGGGGRRHSEVFIHSEIFKARPDVNSVVHTHPDHAIALSATGRPLQPISQPSAYFSDGLPCYTDTINLIRTQEMGARVAQVLGSCKAVLLRNHGVVVVGATLEEATILAITLENACKIQLLAESTGGIGEVFPPEDIKKLHAVMNVPEQHVINFQFLLRQSSKR